MAFAVPTPQYVIRFEYPMALYCREMSTTLLTDPPVAFGESGGGPAAMAGAVANATMSAATAVLTIVFNIVLSSTSPLIYVSLVLYRHVCPVSILGGARRWDMQRSAREQSRPSLSEHCALARAAATKPAQRPSQRRDASPTGRPGASGNRCLTRPNSPRTRLARV